MTATPDARAETLPKQWDPAAVEAELYQGWVDAGYFTADPTSGKPPYSIFLGNAPGVTMEFGGQPVDLRPLTQGNSTARFSVPVAGR